MNGEVRDREKVMRGLKRMDTPILKGYQLYHNYIRPHEGLKGGDKEDAPRGEDLQSDRDCLAHVEQDDNQGQGGDEGSPRSELVTILYRMLK
jgi:hypothetical protein